MLAVCAMQKEKLMLKLYSLRTVCGLMLFGVIAISGCDSGTDADLATVEGTVTFDGKPLPEALVVFELEGSEMTSECVTDDNGHYKLQFSGKRSGAKLGTHVVRIRTSGMENGAKEIIPARYNAESELKKTVNEKSNTFDFRLKSGGKIVDIVGDGEEGESGGNPNDP